MTKFTPGPWYLLPGTYEYGKQLKIKTVDKKNLLYILIGGPNKENDARLLTKTPDLYEAAIEAYDFIEKFSHYLPHDSGVDEIKKKLSNALTF